jgi:FKBP-type peptidyl-prolyl cis-trans isomerase FklB
VLVIASMSAVHAQTGKTKPVAKPVVKTTAPVCKNLYDSVSYAVGMSVANYYKKSGITNLNAAMVSKAINDILGGKQGVLDEASASAVLNSYINAQSAEKSKVNISAGEKFLVQNKTKPGVKTTASGLQYEVLTEGTGSKPTAVTDNVTVNYKGALLDGTEFDNSYKRGQPATFSLNQVIPGWTEGLQLMSTGSKYRFWIPYNLAYGINGRGPSIPGGALLVFEVELMDVKK